MNTFGLTRTFAGILIVDCCHCAQYDHIEENFQLAVQKYSFLVRPENILTAKNGCAELSRETHRKMLITC